MKLRKPIDLTLQTIQVLLVILICSINDFAINVPTITVLACMIGTVCVLHKILSTYSGTYVFRKERRR